MDRSDIELFESSIRQATESHSGEALDAALTEIGWLDALALDPRLAVPALFSRQGSANVTSSALDWLVATTLGTEPDPATAVVLPALGCRDAPGVKREGQLTVQGLGASALGRATRALVVAGPSDGGCLRLVTIEVSELVRRPVDGMDPAYGLVEVTASARVEDAGLDPTDRWDTAVMMAHLALSQEIIGAARTMLSLARQHALDRIQFGQPIAKFQAVRHRLAETLVAIEAADAMLIAAWDDPTPELAAMAKALAGRGARSAARHCQQVLAGIGFTAEHPFHRYFRRVLLLDQLFGSARALTIEFGTHLKESRQLPQLLPL